MNDRLPINPLLVSSRCRLTPKGRLHMDRTRDPRPGRGSEIRTREPRALSFVLQLNDTGRFVLERCDGARSVAELARDLAETWPVSEERATADVLTFLERLRAQGLVQSEE
jgi:hypothetical protein